MKILFLASAVLILTACTPSNLSSSVFESSVDADSKNTVILVGEGGDSGQLFLLSAATYQRENGGTVMEVHSGDEFISRIKIFVEENGPIDHLEYFGHGNELGLFVNQEPGVHGGIYANDPQLLIDYRAASIYELPRSLFDDGASIRFNGCNVANGYPEKNSLAQNFANHFNVTVTAPTGPTEFSFEDDSHSPVRNLKGLSTNFNDDLYMLPTYNTDGFVMLSPQASTKFQDIHEGQTYFNAANELLDRGLDINFVDSFQPYKNVTGTEALIFCRTVFGEDCVYDGSPDEWIRNLYAMKMLVDAAGIPLTPTVPWRDAYIRWSTGENILTDDFVNRTWYTRGEMAELTWAIFTSTQSPML